MRRSNRRSEAAVPTAPRPNRTGARGAATLLDHVSDAVIGADPETRITYWGKGAERMYGFTAAEALGRTTLELLRPTYAEGERERILREIAERGGSVATIRTLRKDGSPIVVEASTTGLEGAAGRPAGFAVVYRDVTERVKTEDDLRDSEAQANALIRYAPTAIYKIDLRGPRFTSVNDAMCGVLGYAREELLAIPPADLLDEESRARFAERMRRQVAGEGLADQVEYRVRAKDGRTIEAVLNVSVNPRQPHLVMVIGHDITARKRMEEEVARARAEAELLSATAGRLLGSTDPQGVIDELCRRVMTHLGCQVFFNFLVDKAAGRLRLNACAGIPEESLPGLRWLDYGSAVCGNVARSGIRVVAEEIGVQPDPRTDLVASFGVRAYACHPLLADSEVLGTLSFGARDRDRFRPEELALMKAVADQVSIAIERMRVLEALRERGLELQGLTESLERRVRERTAELAAANERLKGEAEERVRLVAAVEEAGEGIAVIDKDGRIRYVNAALSRLYGRSRSELLAMTYSELLEKGEPEGEPWAGIRASLDRGEAWRGRFSRVLAGGDTIDLEVSVSPIHDEGGRALNYLAVERDVTREVRLQQHLRQVQKLEALGTLAGGIAHDFNNILNPIFINTELLLMEDSLDAAARRSLEITLLAAERGRDLVKQIIAFSRQKEMVRKPVRVGPVVRDAVRFLQASLPRTVEIGVEIGEETGDVLGDPVQIHQIVMNLCNNAAYSMKDRGGVLSIGLNEAEVDARLAAGVPGLRPGTYVRLTVADTGPGMTPEVRDRAFDPFFTTKKPGQGAGLGLPVVDGIVRDSGGAVQIRSEAGRGTTLTVYLPRVDHIQPAAEPKAAGLPGGTERILILDDEEVQVRSLENLLRSLGYVTAVRTDGREALDLLRTDPLAFDLLITDQTMPYLTGARIAAEALRLRPDLPIILCTGYSEAVNAREARAAGIREFLMKPYAARDIAETIRRALASPPPAKV